LSSATITVTFRRYPNGGTFTIKLDLKNQCLKNHKTVFGTLIHAFWVGAVIASGFFNISMFFRDS